MDVMEKFKKILASGENQQSRKVVDLIFQYFFISLEGWNMLFLLGILKDEEIIIIKEYFHEKTGLISHDDTGDTGNKRLGFFQLKKQQSEKFGKLLENIANQEHKNESKKTTL